MHASIKTDVFFENRRWRKWRQFSRQWITSCELLAGGDARTWRIVITPRDTASARVCVLQVRTDSKDPRDALHGLFALVEKTGREGGRP